MSQDPPSQAPDPPSEHWARRHWVELRIHGVSGTPPEVMLESAHVAQVAGDSWGRFFRPVDGVGTEVQTDPSRTLEGYHWGKYTSGSSLKGLWLILIPFGITNAAAFMLPDPGSSRTTRWWHRTALALIRAIGIGLTSTFALTAGLICVDLLGYSWARGVGWLSALGLHWTMSAGLLVAGLVVLGLFAMGNENRQADFDPVPDGAIAAGSSRGLGRADFYTQTVAVPVLGRLHLAIGWGVLAVVGALTFQKVTASEASPSFGGLVDLIRVVSLVLVGGIAVLVTGLGDPERALNATDEQPWFQYLPFVSALLLWVTGILLWTSIVLLVTTDPADGFTLDLDSYAKWLPLASTVAMLALFVTCLVLGILTRDSLEGTPPPFRRFAHGLAAWAASSTGLFVGVGFCAAFDLGVGKLVKRGAQTDLIYRIAYVWGITAILLAAAGLAIGAMLFVRRHHYDDDVTRSYAHATASPFSPTVPPGRLSSISTARLVADLKWYLAAAVIFFATTGTVMTVVTWTEMFRWHTPRLVAWISQGPAAPGVHQSPTFTVLYNIGTYALIAAAGALFVLGRRALKTESTRRGVNVVWDVISFWPHSVHPFVPPSYAQFAVKDLRRRIRHHLGLSPVPDPSRPDAPSPDAPAIVISAHSQGSLIVFATLLWLGRAERSKVALVTYGSQLQVAFPRGFPAYVDVGLLRLVRTRLRDRWINLYRETDPIAGPVLSWDRSPMPAPPALPTSRRIGAVGARDDTVPPTGRRESGCDWRVLDPPPVDAFLQTTSVTHLSKHSGYPASVDYRDAVARLLAAL
jgi:hypothetical protein